MTESESKLRQRSDGRLDRSRDPAILDAARIENVIVRHRKVAVAL
jgi:hypothetical protein